VADFSIFTGVSGPGTDGGDPAADVNLGHIFQVSSICWAKAIRFWRGATSINGTQKGRIFTVASETVLAGTEVDFPALSGTGWQVATLATPVQLAANTSYKIAVHFTDNYSATGGYWSTGAGVGGRTDGPLTAPDAGGTPLGLGGIQQGSFRYTSDPDAYPNGYFGGGNYWVDVVVTDVDPGSSHTGTGTAPLTLAASGAGSKRAAGTGTAALTVAATRVGAKVGAGTATAAVGLAASGVGVHCGLAAANAPLALAATRTGIHHGSGTGTAALTIMAHGAAAGRDITLTTGPLATGWTVGALASGWSTGQLEV
jgi:uncharacterized protein DUF4082